MSKYIGFIYLTTNLVNGKIYIGQHEFINPTIDRFYIGSGVLFQKALKKYGRKNFKRRVLRLCKTNHELSNWERFYIRKYKSQDKNIGYNIADGDVNTSKHNPCKIDSVKEKISETLKRKFANGEIDIEKIRHVGENHWNYERKYSDEFKKKLSLSHKGKYVGEKHPLFGKHHSAETRKRISEANKAYAKTHHDELSQRSKNAILKHGHPMKGRKHSEEAKRKMSEIRKKWCAAHKQQMSEVMRGKLAGEKHPFWGKKMSEETRRKISEAKKAYYLSKVIKNETCN